MRIYTSIIPDDQTLMHDGNYAVKSNLVVYDTRPLGTYLPVDTISTTYTFDGVSTYSRTSTPTNPTPIVNFYPAGYYKLYDYGLHQIITNDDLIDISNETESTDTLYIDRENLTATITKVNVLMRLTSENEWTYDGTNSRFYTKLSIAPSTDTTSLALSVSSHYTYGTTGDYTFSINDSNLYIRDSRYTDVASFTKWLNNHNVQLAYPRETPEEITCSISLLDITEMSLNEEDSLKSWDIDEERYVPENGIFGQFAARELNGELISSVSSEFNIENKYIEVRMGIVKNNQETNWYSLGTFIVNEPEEDDVSDNATFDAFDLTVLFNQTFDADYISSRFPMSFNNSIANGIYFTAGLLAQYVCEQLNIQLANIAFANTDFAIITNQFTNGESCRDVMKAIAQLAYGWVKVGWDDQCQIVSPVLTTPTDNNYVIDNNQYYSLEVKYNMYGPVNRVCVGYSDIDGENFYTEDTESISTNGLTTLYINDNPLVYNESLMLNALDMADILFGFKYLPFTAETIGHPYFDAGTPINVVNMDGNTSISYPFNIKLSYTGHIKTTIEAPAYTQAQTTYAYDKTIYNELKNVSIVVDKQAGTIKELSSKITAAEDGLSAIETNVVRLTTDTYTKTEINKIISGQPVDGQVVSSVQTTTGTFDENGLTINKTGAATQSNYNENGITIQNATGTKNLLIVNSDGLTGDNVSVEKYLCIGTNSRLEDYTDTTNGKGTAVFWTGDD